MVLVVVLDEWRIGITDAPFFFHFVAKCADMSIVHLELRSVEAFSEVPFKRKE